MKRSNLCIGFLTLFVPVVLSFLICLDTNALKHDYKGIPLLTPAIPSLKHDSNNYIDWNTSTTDFFSYNSAPFYLRFEGDAWDDSLSDLRVRKELRVLNTVYDNTVNQCKSLNNGYNSGLNSIYSDGESGGPTGTGLRQSYPYIYVDYDGISQFSVNYNSSFPNYRYIPDFYHGNKFCWSRSGMSNIDTNSYNFNKSSGLPSWPNDREPLIYNVSTIINNDNIFPYNYYTDTLTFESSHKQSDGVVYSKRFSFNTIFNRNINKFSRLQFSLNEYGGYWYDDSNLYNGRDIDFHFLFQFENSFTLSDTFLHGGSLSLHAIRVPKVYDSSLGSSQADVHDYNCISTVRQVGEDGYYWDINCPVTLDKDYIVFVPSLDINGNQNKVFETDGNWYFSSVYIVTDNDSTPGRDFNDSPTGNTDIWDAYWSDNNNQANPGDADWLQTLASLFSFDFFNPFAPIFQMFSDNNSCAQIPVLASMIHSEETQVCPWFDSTTRNIVTPVLGLASMMLVFGFAVRWLGSSSGNMFEDSGQHDISSNSTLRSKWRKK